MIISLKSALCAMFLSTLIGFFLFSVNDNLDVPQEFVVQDKDSQREPAQEFLRPICDVKVLYFWMSYYQSEFSVDLSLMVSL